MQPSIIENKGAEKSAPLRSRDQFDRDDFNNILNALKIYRNRVEKGRIHETLIKVRNCIYDLRES